MFKKLAAVLIAASVIGAPMIVSSAAQAQTTQTRTVIKTAKPHKVVVVKKRSVHRHHAHRHHAQHVTVVKHRKHVHRHNGPKTVVIKKVTHH